MNDFFLQSLLKSKLNSIDFSKRQNNIFIVSSIKYPKVTAQGLSLGLAVDHLYEALKKRELYAIV